MKYRLISLNNWVTHDKMPTLTLAELPECPKSQWRCRETFPFHVDQPAASKGDKKLHAKQQAALVKWDQFHDYTVLESQASPAWLK